MHRDWLEATSNNTEVSAMPMRNAKACTDLPDGVAETLLHETAGRWRYLMGI